jgi:zinc and cadmium transporter
MIELLYAILSGLAVAFASLIFVVIIYWKEKILNDILMLLVALAAGTMIGGGFLHLLPEAIEVGLHGHGGQGAVKVANVLGGQISLVFLFVIIGFIIFYITEKILDCQQFYNNGEVRYTFHYMTIIGSAIHIFIDGIIIAASFVISMHIGFITFLMVAAHEIPKKVGEFGVLVYGGFEKKKALKINFVTSLPIIIGVIVGFIISMTAEVVAVILLPIAAGGFIYIGAADLLPEVRKEGDIRQSILVFEFFILGILIMWLVTLICHSGHLH